MRFTVLSHAGLLVEHAGKQILCDPWLLGSCYWRSWWNYPPVDPALIENLKPDYIFLTHLHWDHFHGPSLRKFARSTPIVIPQDHFTRMGDDLCAMRFTNIIELPHGACLPIAPDFRVFSYHFLPTTDSALAIEAGQQVLLNANDCKLMGLPLRQLQRRHPHIDFVLRSHSSANDRACYEFTDAVNYSFDDPRRYADSFCSFVDALQPRYAIPFASNHCYLHPESYAFNHNVQTPPMVEAHFAKVKAEGRCARTEIKTMVSGDSWDEQHGFRLQPHDYFTQRERHLADYRSQVQDKLAESHARDDRTELSMDLIIGFFAKFSRAVPWLLRRAFRDKPLLLALKAGARTHYIRVDMAQGTCEQLEADPGGEEMLRLHTSLAIFQHAIKVRLLTYMAISRRVTYRMRQRNLRHMQLFNLLLTLYEYELIPLHRLFRWRLAAVYVRRWREVILYMQVARDLWLRGLSPLRIEQKYLNLGRPAAQPAALPSPVRPRVASEGREGKWWAV